jgi:hypothetical protein
LIDNAVPVARLLLRFLLVPLGYLFAVLVGSFVVVFSVWKFRQGAIDLMPPFQEQSASLVAAAVLVTVLLSLMWLPATVGILISEAFAIRSWIFHAANGALSAWIGWNLSPDLADAPIRIHEPIAVIGAGLAGGFAYWAVAGSSAGFWKPVFRQPDPAASSPPQIR